MPESDQHQRLILRLVDYIKARFAKNYSLTILDDLPKAIGSEKPPTIGNFRPDVYAVDVPETIVIVGEAKSVKDLESFHSRDQYRSFLSFLSKRENSYFLLAVPFQSVPAARRVISSIMVKLNLTFDDVTVVVLDEISERVN